MYMDMGTDMDVNFESNLVPETLQFFQRTGLVNVTKKHLQLFYGRKIRQAKQKGDDQRLRAITNYAKKTGGG
jgi:hypothetical protein